MSVTLFELKINSLASVIPREVFASMYVEDLLTAYAHHDQQELEQKLQTAVNNVNNWTEINGFKFSTDKTKVMQFYKNSAPAYATQLKIKNRSIRRTATASSRVKLGSKLEWKGHISTLKIKCAKDLNLLRSITSSGWGADQQTLMRIYRMIIRPKIDYGYIVSVQHKRKNGGHWRLW